MTVYNVCIGTEMKGYPHMPTLDDYIDGRLTETDALEELAVDAQFGPGTYRELLVAS